LTIIICESETLVHDDTVFSYTLDIIPNADTTSVNLTNFFQSNDPYCPPITWEIVTIVEG
jgi:hypothetical protein